MQENLYDEEISLGDSDVCIKFADPKDISIFSAPIWSPGMIADRGPILRVSVREDLFPYRVIHPVVRRPRRGGARRKLELLEKLVFSTTQVIHSKDVSLGSDYNEMLTWLKGNGKFLQVSGFRNFSPYAWEPMRRDFTVLLWQRSCVRPLCPGPIRSYRPEGGLALRVTADGGRTRIYVKDQNDLDKKQSQHPHEIVIV